ncbi:MAG: Ribonuclease P protein component 1 [Promethearchaeota archaeon]|nr:MAG: Ribonuclease P protein component 1 [Candidatus Lokiarchaeota archaeon]
MKFNINPKYVIYHDLIGFEVYIKPKSSNKGKKTFISAGIVIDDTENMLYIKTHTNEIKKYIKNNYIFRIKLPEQKKANKINILQVDGSKIVGRPENRLRHLKKKKRFRK